MAPNQSGEGGEAGGSGGNPSGGTGGHGGTGGTGTPGGGTGGSTDAGMSGIPDAGDGGLPPCTDPIEVSAGDLREVVIQRVTTPHVVKYVFDLTPELGSSSPDTLEVAFYNGEDFDGIATGSFSLASTSDSSPLSCSRCLLAHQDTGAAPSTQRHFFQTEGTLSVAPASQQLDGFPDFTLDDVTLREVTLDATTRAATFVRDGACLHLTAGAYSLPPTWNCPESFQTDTDCDCGCAVPDPACESDAVTSCDLCWCEEAGACIGYEVPERNWACR